MFTLARESGENAYHRIGKYISHRLVTDLDFAFCAVPGGQFRWLSPMGRYSRRLQFVHCRGERQVGAIRVNAKGPETRTLTEANARVAGSQMKMVFQELEDPNEPIPLDSPLTIWVITHVYSAKLIHLYLAVSMMLNKSGKKLIDLEDVYRLDEINFDDDGFAATTPQPVAPETGPFDVVVEDI